MKEQYKDMNSYITQGTTITVQTAVLKETLEGNKDILNNEKELLKQTLINRIEELDADKIVREEDRANCYFLKIDCRFA